MNKPVTSIMKQLVNTNIGSITTEHQKIISGWENIEMSDENIRHLYNLFTKCSRHQIRVFEDGNFLGEENRQLLDLMSTKLPIHKERVLEKNKRKPKETLKQMEGVEAVTKKADFHQAQKDLKELKNPVEKKNGLTQQLELQVDSKKNRSDLKNDDHLFAKPQLIVNTNFPRKNTMEPPEKESNLKNNLQKLATDLSQQEKAIKNKMNLGEPANVDNEVLADFISRANTVLKETEAVTVRKIAEAETKKLLSVSHVTSEPFFGAISNELVQDIWPKTNRWRQISRLNDDSDPVDPKQKRKLEEKIDKTVKTTIKAAGEPLTKKQIGQIRNAAIVYRDFDEIEQKELDFRSNQTTKLVKYVSAYEATNQMDELTRYRLAIAFCRKRRDYFLKCRPQNFMQFSYMYIHLLEKVNSKTASICACLNNKTSKKSEFDELEELMLNLFHENYFLEETEKIEN